VIGVYVGLAGLMIPLVIYLLVGNSGPTPTTSCGPSGRWCSPGSCGRCSSCSAEEAKKLVVALVLVLFSIMFWGIFEQSGGSLAIVAENNLATSAKDTLPDLDQQQLELGLRDPVRAAARHPVAEAMKDKEPDSVVKFALGFVFLAGGYWVFQSLISVRGPDRALVAGRSSRRRTSWSRSANCACRRSACRR
jgi:hypothetical protein